VVGMPELLSVFSTAGIPIRKASLQTLQGKVSDRDVRDFLVEVGIPEQVGEGIFLRRIHRECLTFNEFLRRRGRAEVTDMGDFLFLGAGAASGVILLNGATGEVFAWTDESSQRVSEKLESFVGSLCRVQEGINELDSLSGELYDATSESMVGHVMRRLSAAEGGVAAGAGEYWENLVRSLFQGRG
jgi:hypothetical protein